MPGFAIDYEIDPVRQAIADCWPRSLDDSAARDDWGFAPRFDLEAMTADMLARLETKLAAAREPIAERRHADQQADANPRSALDELRTSGRLKGAEAVTVGILPPPTARARASSSRGRPSAASCA